MPNMIRNLTDKQKLFIEYFSSTGNATASCIKAGYSKATAEQQGYELKNKLQWKQTSFFPSKKTVFSNLRK